MTGILQIKNGKYYCVLDYKDEKGVRKRKWVSTKLEAKGNKRKATEILNNLLAKYAEKELGSNSDDILFTDYLLQWFDKKKNKVETVTFEGYNTLVDRHIIPYFERKKLSLSEIKPSHIADFYESEFKNGRCDGKGGLSIKTIKMMSFIIKAALEDAAFHELILRNPASKVPLPKKEEEEKNCIFLDTKSANEVLKYFRGHHLQPLIYTVLYYGLRRSEVLGLKWDAIDFANDTIEIRHTVVEYSTIVSKNKTKTKIEAKDKTKTAAGRRKYALLPEVKEILLNLKEESQNNKKILGKEYRNTDYIFVWPNGNPYRPDYITKTFQKVLSKNNFPRMRFHDLRHSCASILYDKGWELKDIQTWLGHADIETTANIYTHISASRKNNMAKDIQHTFSL